MGSGFLGAFDVSVKTASSRIMKKSMAIWRKYVLLPGAIVGDSVGIASEQAISGVLNCINKFRPLRILELGAGIGTLTYTALNAVVRQQIHKQKGYAFFTIENNDFCLQQLRVNIKDFDGLYAVLSSTKDLPQDLLFDLIIVDGGGDLDGDMGIMFFGDRLAQKGVIFVEGTRKFQRDLIESWYGARKHVHVKMPAFKTHLSDNTNKMRAHNKAYHLYRFEPSWLDVLELRLRSSFTSIAVKILRRLAAQDNQFL